MPPTIPVPSNVEPIAVHAYKFHKSSGVRFLESINQGKRCTSTSNDSDLLKSIRAAFQGSGKEPGPPFRTTTSASAEGIDGEDELAWDNTTVALSTGGTLQQTWSFAEEGQRIQYACFGWLWTEGTVRPSHPARHSEDDNLSLPIATEHKPEREIFGPFFRARKIGMRTIENPAYSRGVFVFLRSFGKIFLLNGLEYSFSLPFIVHRAWPLTHHGILLERVVEPSELDEPDPLPRLYSFTNPFQEPRPVGWSENIRGGHGFSPLLGEISKHELEGNGRSIHAVEQIAWVAPRSSDMCNSGTVFATLDRMKKKLSFWRYAYIPHAAAPRGGPTNAQNALNDKGGPSGTKAHAHPRIASRAAKDMKARTDRIRAPSPDFEPSQPAEFAEMPPLSALPGMAPALSSTTTLASLASASSGVSQLPSNGSMQGRKTSQARNELSSTMIFGRRSEPQKQAMLPVSMQAIVPIYWAERLYEYQLSDEDSELWQNISFAIYDERFNGKEARCVIAFCVPASQLAVRLKLWPVPEDNTLKLDFLSTRLKVQSIAAVKSTRPRDWDLLMLKSDHSLSLHTFDNVELPLRVIFSGLDDSDPALSDAPKHDDLSDTSMSSVSTCDLKIIGLQDALVSTVRLALKDGRVARLAINLVPSDPVVADILQVLTVYCRGDDFSKIYAYLLHSWIKRDKTCSPTVQFDCIAEAILKNWGVAWVSMEKEETATSASPFDKLLHSSAHFRLRDDTALLPILPTSPRPHRLPTFRDLSRTDEAALHRVLMGLHVLGEEYRLAVHKHESLLRLSSLTLRLAQLIRPGFSDLLKRYYPSSSSGWTLGIDMSHKDEVMLPVDVTSALHGRLAQPEHLSTLLETTASRINLSHAYSRMDVHATAREFTQLFSVFSDPKQNDGRKRAEATVLMMAQRQFGIDYLSLLPLAFSVPLREASRTCQLGPPPDWPMSAYEFVGRTDLTESGKASGDLIFNDGYRSMKDHLPKKGDVPRKSYRALYEDVHRALGRTEEAVTGVELEITDFTDVRFGQDRRLQEVARMLRSSNVPSIRMMDRPDLNEHDFAKEQQMQVLRTAERTLALPIGRAMFTFATMPSVTREVYTVPKIELAIRLQPQNIVISPEPGKMPLEGINWAEFHNGIAAALRISPSMGTIDSSWITFNKPNELTPQHAGFLYGLGLTGHLKHMLTWQTFGYLTPKHELTSIGILLGLAASYMGSGNMQITKLIAIHTPAFLPTPDVDLNVPFSTQAAGLMAMGLLHMGTKNRRLAEVALHQISRSDFLQPDIRNENREAYTVAAGLSFGMIMLGRGMATTSPADVALVSRLRVLIHGEGSAVFQTKPVKQSFDVNLTSPAATMALGLMYLRTDRQAVADILNIPDTIEGLNHIQPNFVLLRTIARNLIMWSDIKPTREWLLGQVPQPIMRIMETRLPYQGVDDAIELAYYHITAAAIFVLALKYAGTASQQAYAIIAEFYEFFRRTSWHSSPSFDHRIKRAASRDGLSLVTLAMGMVMVGTGEISCLKRLRLAHGMYNQPIRYGSHMATHMALGLLFLGEGRFSLGNSDAAVACMVAAFYPHFPALSSDNRSYLPAFRHLWVLAAEPRCLVARDVDTKEVVYLPMKIRVKEENGNITTLQLIAPTLIPSLDRLLSIKIDTPRYWPYLLDIASNTRHIAGLLLSQTIFVKRRTMFLSYMEDPRGSRSLFVRSRMSTADAATLDFPKLSDTGAHPASDLQHYITSYSNDISFVSFADRLCRNDGITDEEKIFNRYCHAALLDCIIQDKPQMLSPYLLLYRARVMDPRSRYFPLVLQDLLHLDDFYAKLFERRFSCRTEGITRPALLRESSVSGTLLAVDKKLASVAQGDALRSALRAYVLNNGSSEHLRNSDPTTTGECHPRKRVEENLAWYLLRHSVPYAPYFPALRQLALEALGKYQSLPPPEGTAGTIKYKELEKGLQLVMLASVTGLVRPFGSWTVDSFNDVLRIWQTS